MEIYSHTKYKSANRKLFIFFIYVSVIKVKNQKLIQERFIMKFIKNILVINILLFFIGCTAWPALIPVPPGKKKTSVYPIPLPGQTTSTVAAVRIADDKLAALANIKLAFGNPKQLKAIDKTGKEIATGITWKTSDGTIAGVDPASGLVTAVKVGDVIITATETSSSSAGTLNISITATGASILAFDVKEFKELSYIPGQQTSEAK